MGWVSRAAALYDAPAGCAHSLIGVSPAHAIRQRWAHALTCRDGRGTHHGQPDPPGKGLRRTLSNT